MVAIAGAIGFVSQALALTPLIVKAGMDISEFVASINAVVAKGDPTAEDWAALHAREDALRKQLNTDPPDRSTA